MCSFVSFIVDYFIYLGREKSSLSVLEERGWMWTLPPPGQSQPPHSELDKWTLLAESQGTITYQEGSPDNVIWSLDETGKLFQKGQQSLVRMKLIFRNLSQGIRSGRQDWESCGNFFSDFCFCFLFLFSEPVKAKIVFEMKVFTTILIQKNICHCQLNSLSLILIF